MHLFLPLAGQTCLTFKIHIKSDRSKFSVDLDHGLDEHMNEHDETWQNCMDNVVPVNVVFTGLEYGIIR